MRHRRIVTDRINTVGGIVTRATHGETQEGARGEYIARYICYYCRRYCHNDGKGSECNGKFWFHRPSFFPIGICFKTRDKTRFIHCWR